MSKVTKEYIDTLLKEVVVHTTAWYIPTPNVQAVAWLGTFQLGTAISKAVDPNNFDEELGIEYSTKDALKIAENKLWELEGYHLYKTLKGDK
jgi:hypothetical protein